MYKITSRWNTQHYVNVMWNLGKRCNYDCSYCPAEIHDNFSKHTPIKILKDTVDQLCAINKPLKINFTGGEPTVHPKFVELLKYLKEKNVEWVSLTSNGTRKVSWYLENEYMFDHILFSLHFEYNWKRVLTVIEQYHEKTSKKFFINVMAHHDYMEDVKFVINRFDQLGIRYAIRRIRWGDVRDVFDDSKYKDEDLKWIISKESTAEPNCLVDDEKIMVANDIIKNHLNQFKGWECSIGIESLMINWDGDVHRATCRVGGSLGNIYHKTFKIPQTTIKCTRNWCTCAADIYITKQLI